jgi:beta-lactamase regulating signal transducer with metallopeptidase domain
MAALVVPGAAAAESVRDGNFGHLADLLANRCSSLPHVMAGGAAGILVLLPTLVLVSVAVAATRAAIAALRVRALLSSAGPAPAKLRHACERAGYRGRVSMLPHAAPCAFAAGILVRTVIVSAGAVERLCASELAAVVAHEAHHVRRHHPLKSLLLSTVALGMWTHPTVRAAARRCSVHMELSADAHAVSTVGRGALASALLHFLDEPDALAAPGITGNGQLDQRMAALVGSPVPAPPTTRRERLLTAVSHTLVLVLLVIGATVPPMH